MSGGGPYAITTGPDGALWFTMVHSGQIGRLVPGGELTCYPLDPGCRPTINVTGPDNSMSGRLECVESTISNKSGLQIVPAAGAPMPQPPHDVAYYRALAQEISPQ